VLAQDLRYGLRILAKTPTFTAIALLTLMLGIGATAAIFSVVDAVLIRPLPFRNPDRLVSLFEDFSSMGFARNTPAAFNYVQWKAQHKVLEDVAATVGSVYNLTASDGDPEKLEGQRVTANLFSLLGVRPLLGRSFLPEEDRDGGPKAALISHRLWKRYFAGDPNLVNRPILLNGEKYTVVGVMPSGFAFPSKDSDIWTPAQFSSGELANRGRHYLQVFGRLRPGVTIDQANAALQVLRGQLARQYPDTHARIQRFFAEPLQQTFTRDVHRGLIVLMIAVGFTLLIACANIANLLLARNSVRQREIAVRSALGAARARIIRQMLTESGLLAIGGAVLGILAASLCFQFLKNLIPDDLSRTVALEFNWQVLAFTLLISVVCSVFFGLAPALQLAKVDLNEILKEGSRGNLGSRRRLFRNALVVAEVALSFTLLVGAGLLLKSLIKMRGLDPGFRADHVLSVRLVLSPTRYGDNIKRAQFFEELLQRVRALGDVQSSGVTSALPLTWKGGTSGFRPEGVPIDPRLDYDANNRVVSSGYIQTMKIPLKRGRLFNDSDGRNAPLVALINETMARKYWPNQDPVGKRFATHPGGPEAQLVRIIGIVGDIRQMGLNEPPRQEMYFPMFQSANNWMVPRDLVIRTRGNPAMLADAVRQAVWSADRDQPVSNIMTLDDLLDEEVAQRRVQTLLLGGLSALALLLSCIGIYGVLSYLVAQRTREIGIRVALGAIRTDVFRAIAGQGLGLTAAGIAIGFAASLALTRLLGSLLFQVAGTDLVTYVSAASLFAAVAWVACLVPASRAARVDPMVALRDE
jgi:putative ABC transport system permease protein